MIIERMPNIGVSLNIHIHQTQSNPMYSW